MTLQPPIRGTSPACLLSADDRAALGGDVIGRPAPTIAELAASATRAEHLLHAACQMEVAEIFSGRIRQRDWQALQAILATARDLVADVAVELRTAEAVAERQEKRAQP